MCGAELKVLPEGVQRVAGVLQAQGHPHTPVMLDDAARTAQQAADALGVAVGQIAKSIIFRRKSDDVAVLVVTSGDPRGGEKKGEALGLPEPCISICRMSASSGLCEGCFRTGDEIASWSSAGNDGKRALWKLIEQRMDALQGATVM